MRETECFSIYSLISMRITAFSSPNIASPSARHSSVLPTPVGPRKINDPTGRFGSLSPARALRLGVTTNLANPKALLFFGAVFAQFVRPDMGVGWAVAVGVLLVATGVAWFTGFALAVRAMAARIARNSVLIDIVTGLVFIALGVFMVISAAG